MGENYHGLLGSVSNSGGLHLQFRRSPPLSEIPISLSHTSDKEQRILLSEEVQSDLERSNREGSGSFSIYRFLLLSFLSSQENWRYETSYRFFYPEYVFLGTPFQNGNQSFHQILYPPWDVDNKPRSHGCVLSHPYCSSLQKMSSFCLEQYSIPISNTPIRDLNGSPNLHKSVSNSNSSSAHTVYSDSFLSRRFSDQGFRSTNSCFPNGIGNSAFSKSVFFLSWKKSELTPSQNFLFLGEHYRTDLGLIFPPEENIVFLCQRIMLFQHSVRNSQTVFSTARFPQLARGSDSARASPHSAPTVLSSSTLASSLSRLGSKDPSSSFTVTSPTVVDKQGECDERSISVSTSSYPNSLYRCFQPVLGSLSRGKLSLRVVVSSTTEGTHQPVGDESSSSGIVSFQSNSPSQISGSGNRQYYRGSLFEKPGRHSLFQPVFSLQGDSPSLLGTSDSTGSEAYSRSSQCTSRHTVTFFNTSEHGM